MVELNKEERRLLRHLAKQHGILEVPARNPAIHSIVERGLAFWRGSWQEHWNHREHSMSNLVITDAGRKAISE